MTLAMDFRLATTDATLDFVFGKLGIVPEPCSSVTCCAAMPQSTIRSMHISLNLWQ